MKNTIIWMTGLMLLCTTVMAQTPDNTLLEIYQIKVNEGHATLLVTKKKDDPSVVYSSTLIDAGKGNDDAETIEGVIKAKAGGKLDAVFVTHHDVDHWGGLTNSSADNDALLARRCKTSGSLYSEKKLKLYYNHTVTDSTNNNNKTNDNSPYGLDNWNKQKIKDEAGNKGENIDIFQWNNQTADYPLVPANNGPSFIWLKTLAVNGYLRDEKDKSKRLLLGSSAPTGTSKKKRPPSFKNNASAVALITWDDFSFLIQGDLEAAFTGKYTWQQRTIDVETQGKSFEIKMTAGRGKTSMINPKWMSDNNKSQLTWNSTTARTNKATADPQELSLTDPNYIIRMGPGAANKKKKRKRKDEIEEMVDQLEVQDWVAAPNDWHHRLGQKIAQENGTGKYAYACMALVPHHAGLTSNLWFNTDHAIIGSNKSNRHNHPNKNSIIALHNTARPKYLYVTYLLDMSRRKALNENVFQAYAEGHLPTDDSFITYYLDGKGKSTMHGDNGIARNKSYMKGPVGNLTGNSYFQFTVRKADNSNKKEVQVQTDKQALVGWSECSGGN